MSEPKKPISHAKEPEPKPDMDKKASSKGGSHVRKRKLRFDRIAAVFVPLLLIVLLLLGGMIIALIGVVGEYIGRIYLSINRSPQFVVRSVTRGAAEGIHQPEEREMNADEDHACGLGA